jgi:cytochrome bd ubiquinol oxidase subunit I
MSNVDLARVEFAFVTINHFFFVPITIGLAFLTALLQTAWVRSGRDDYPAADPVLRHAAGHPVGKRIC